MTYRLEAQYVSLSLCTISLKSQMVSVIQQCFLFGKWWLYAILDLWGAYWNDLQRVPCGLYHCSKFRWNHYSNFDNTKV